MITRIEIDGYKSFKGFSLDLFPFVVIAGSNAVGKSNLFDALRHLSKLATKTLREAFETERGSLSDLFTIYPDGSSQDKITYAVEMLLPASIVDDFSEETELEYRRLRYELSVAKSGEGGLAIVYERLAPIRFGDDTLLKSEKYSYVKAKLPQLTEVRTPFIDTERLNIIVSPDGNVGSERTFSLVRARRSVLSSVTTIEFPHIYAAQQVLEGSHFFQFNPEKLRQPSRFHNHTLTAEGENLPSMLARLVRYDEDVLKMISNDLAAVIPTVDEVYLEEDASREEYAIKVRHVDGYWMRSHLLSDGTLRTLALAAISYDPTFSGVILLEEPENGIHPRRIIDIVALLRNATCLENAASGATQILINTHSVHAMDAAHNDELVFATLKKIVGSEHGSYMATEMGYVAGESSSLGNLVARHEAKRLMLETRSVGIL